MQDYKTEKIDITLSWSFVGQSILALLDCNTNIKPEDREFVRGQLVDMAGAGDKGVDACKLLETLRVTADDEVEDVLNSFFTSTVWCLDHRVYEDVGAKNSCKETK